jgi:hypothetical protein
LLSFMHSLYFSAFVLFVTFTSDICDIRLLKGLMMHQP